MMNKLNSNAYSEGLGINFIIFPALSLILTRMDSDYCFINERKVTFHESGININVNGLKSNVVLYQLE